MSNPVDIDAVVIGSGFGGTIAALTLTNFFATRNKGEKVCILERGQWWISHELPYRGKNGAIADPNMREFLQNTGREFSFWAHPDNVEGVLDIGSKVRLVNRSGLYDYRQLSDNVGVIAASGVGGGSLVYSNVTLKAPASVYKNWPTESEGKSLDEYFEPAKAFIGVNRITRVAGLGKPNTKLEKSLTFQQAADKVRADPAGTILNPKDNEPDLGFALDLSITDVPDGAFANFTKDNVQSATPQNFIEALKQQNQQNVCQRQGRCNLGCLPGARHTLNKKIVNVLMLQDKKKMPDVLDVRTLCEADLIEFVEPDRYRIRYKRYRRDSNTPIATETIVTKILVLAAGTLGTNELLLRSQANGLNVNHVGEGFSTDGDLLGLMALKERRVDITRGPINTCHALFRGVGDQQFRFSIEDTTISKMVADIFATIFELSIFGKRTAHGSWLTRLKQGLKLAWRFKTLGALVVMFGVTLPRLQKMLARALRDDAVVSVLSDIAQGIEVKNKGAKNFVSEIIELLTRDPQNPFASPEERLSKFYVFSCMGLDNADGLLSLHEDKLQLAWSPENNRKIFDDIIQGMKQLADKIEPDGSKRVYAPTWNSKSPRESSLTVLHPLGGCIMGKNADEGTVNSYGQVFRNNPQDRRKSYSNFYIMDGSIVPSALGVNSSFTIAALAFRCVENLVQSLGGDRSSWPDWNLIQKTIALEQSVQTP